MAVCYCVIVSVVSVVEVCLFLVCLPVSPILNMMSATEVFHEPLCMFVCLFTCMGLTGALYYISCMY